MWKEKNEDDIKSSGRGNSNSNHPEENMFGVCKASDDLQARVRASHARNKWKRQAGLMTSKWPGLGFGKGLKGTQVPQGKLLRSCRGQAVHQL